MGGKSLSKKGLAAVKDDILIIHIHIQPSERDYTSPYDLAG